MKERTKSGNVKAVYRPGRGWIKLKKCRCNRYPNVAGGNRVSCACGLSTKGMICGEYQHEVEMAINAWNRKEVTNV